MTGGVASVEADYDHIVEATGHVILRMRLAQEQLKESLGHMSHIRELIEDMSRSIADLKEAVGIPSWAEPKLEEAE